MQHWWQSTTAGQVLRLVCLLLFLLLRLLLLLLFSHQVCQLLLHPARHCPHLQASQAQKHDNMVGPELLPQGMSGLLAQPFLITSMRASSTIVQAKPIVDGKCKSERERLLVLAPRSMGHS